MKSRLVGVSQVNLTLADSRKALQLWLQGDVARFKNQPIFANLDANWHDDLPLKDELEVFFGVCSYAVVMIDDFQVLGDKEYGYDDYGKSKTLDRAYTAEAVVKFDLSVIYPKTPSGLETRANRWCFVLCSPEMASAVAAIQLLRHESNA